MKLVSTWLLLVSIGLFTGSSALARPTCVHPDTDNFLEHSRAAIGFSGTYYPFPSAKFLIFKRNGMYFQWMAASWLGPPGGALFVLDCKGSRVAALPLGQVERFGQGPVIPGVGTALEVVYVSAEGTGDEEKKVTLVAFTKASIVSLWDHEASESVSDLGFNADYTDDYSWSYSDSGTVIRVTGKRVVGGFPDTAHGWAPYTTHAFANETFCWKRERFGYISCKNEQ